MKLEFEGKIALVTGASTGIGRATAIALGSAGCRVAVNYNTSEKEALEVVATIRQAGGDARAYRADVSQYEQAKQLVESVVRDFGGLDILVNNAGSLIERAPVEKVSLELWHKIMSVNLHSVFYCCQAAIPYLRKSQSPRIINVGSIAGHTGGGGGSVPYGTAKGAVHTFTRGLARELANDKITVNGVAPGLIDTPFHQRFTPPERYQELQREIPLKRAGTPEETAAVILFLASPQASYITGEIIEVNGGQYMH